MRGGPFPGMDPYLEGPRWYGFARSFIVYCSEWLNARLPDDYDADIEVSEPRTVIEPIVTYDGRRAAITQERRSRHIRLSHLASGKLVSVIELLSPSDKESRDLGDYGVKQQEYLSLKLGVVEIDLLLGGHRPAFDPPAIGDYAAYVTRPGRPRDCEVYGWRLADKLPTVPLPLRPEDGQIGLDLAAVFAMTYTRGGYPRRMRYDEPCPAPLTKSQRTWVMSVDKAIPQPA